MFSAHNTCSREEKRVHVQMYPSRNTCCCFPRANRAYLGIKEYIYVQRGYNTHTGERRGSHHRVKSAGNTRLQAGESQYQAVYGEIDQHYQASSSTPISIYRYEEVMRFLADWQKSLGEQE